MANVRPYQKTALTSLASGHRVVVDHFSNGLGQIDWAALQAQILALVVDPSTGKLRTEFSTQSFTSEQVAALTDLAALVVTDLQVNKRLVRVVENSRWYIARAAGTGLANWLVWYDPAGQFGLGTAASRNAPATGNAAAAEVVLGSDTRLTGNAPAATSTFQYGRFIECRVATTGNVALTGLQTIDGITLAAGDYVAVIANTTGTENGVYVAASTAWVRATEMPAGTKAELIDLHITAGTRWAGSWLVSASPGQVIGSTAVVWTKCQTIGGPSLTKGASYTVTPADTGLVIRPTAGSLTFTLPLATEMPAGVLVMHGDAYGCTVTCAGSDLFLLADGTSSASVTLTTGQSLIIQANGTNRWLILAKNSGGQSGTKTFDVFDPLNAQPPSTNFATQGQRASGILDAYLRTLDFNDTTEQSIQWVGVLPEGCSLASGVRVRMHWRGASATSGNVRWVAQIGRLGSPSGTPIEVTSAVPASNTTSGTAASCAEVVLTSLGGLTTNREPYFLTVIRRAADAVNDTMVGDAQLLCVELAGA